MPNLLCLACAHMTSCERFGASGRLAARVATDQHLRTGNKFEELEAYRGSDTVRTVARVYVSLA